MRNCARVSCHLRARARRPPSPGKSVCCFPPASGSVPTFSSTPVSTFHSRMARAFTGIRPVVVGATGPASPPPPAPRAPNPTRSLAHSRARARCVMNTQILIISLSFFLTLLSLSLSLSLSLTHFLTLLHILTLSHTLSLPLSLAGGGGPRYRTRKHTLKHKQAHTPCTRHLILEKIYSS